MRRALLILLVAAAMCSLFVAPALAYDSTAELLDAQFLGPHNSAITGKAICNAWRWYGFDVLPMLCILGAETSLGDPELGGSLVGYNNFGCIRAFSGWQSTKWGEWANGTVTVAGKSWLTWPTAEIGVYAWGRYLKVGVNGAYRSILNTYPINWRAFANIYYGKSVPGIEHYISNLYALEASFRAKAAKYGFGW